MKSIIRIDTWNVMYHDIKMFLYMMNDYGH